MSLVDRFSVLGVHVSALTLDRAVHAICEWVTSRQRQYVCVTGVHGVMESHAARALRHIHNEAGLVTPDGMPLVWIGRHLGRDIGRVYGPDLMAAVCGAPQASHFRHYFYGGGPGVPELLSKRLRDRLPSLAVVGTLSPPFRALSHEEDEEVIRTINTAAPDIVWVGLSTPKQERWMADHRARLDAPVLIGVGAAFDFHAGLKPQAPPWMQRSGLEWLFRLATEPRRLWRRYLRNNPMFMYHIALQLTGLRRYE